MTKFGIEKKDNKIQIFESKTKTVCVPFIKPKYLENIVECLNKPSVLGYVNEKTESHYISKYKDEVIVKIGIRQRTDLVNYINKISILF